MISVIIAPFVFADINADLWGHWCFETDFSVCSTDHRATTKSGSSSQAVGAGVIGNAWNFTGGGLITASNSSGRFNWTHDFTMCSWVQTRDNSTSDQTLIGYGSGSDFTFFVWRLTPRWRFFDDALALDYFAGFAENIWVHACTTFNASSNTTIWLDGVKVITSSAIGSVLDNHAVAFGALLPDFPADNLVGLMDEIVIYNRTLGEADILDLANGSVPVPVIPVCESDLIFLDAGGSQVTSVGEFVPFSVAINLTWDINASPVDNAVCNVTVPYFDLQDLSYDPTNQFYNNTKTLNISQPNFYNVSYACDSFCNISSSEIFEIINSPPVINQINLTTNETLTLTEAINITFVGGSWTWTAFVNETNISSIAWNFYNNTGGLINSQTQTPPITTAAGLFVNAAKAPFNVSVLVTDGSAATDFVSYTFNTGDIITPVCTGLGDESTAAFISYTWAASCTDDNAINSFNISCDGERYTFFETDINSTPYGFAESIDVFDESFSCAFEVCDDVANCLSDVQFFVVTAVEPEEFFSSVPEALFFMFLTAFWFGLVIAVFTLTGRSGDTIQIFNIFQVIVGITVFLLWFRFSVPVGFAGIFVSVGIFIGLNMNR